MRALQVMRYRGGASLSLPGGTLISRLLFNGPNNSTTFTDETGRIWTPSGAAKISTAQSVSGGSSAYFDGTGGIIETPASSDFAFNVGGIISTDFAIRLFVMLNAIGSDMTLIGNYLDSNDGWSMQYRPSAAGFKFSYGDYALLDASWAPSANVWHQVDLSRSGGVFTAAIDGEPIGTANRNTIIGSGGPLLIGGLRFRGNIIQRANAYVDYVTIVKGSTVIPA